MATTRYVYEKAKATYTLGTSSQTINELCPAYSDIEDDDGLYPYSYIYIINNFSYYARTYTFRYTVENYLYSYGEQIMYVIKSYTEQNGTEIEVGYDEETGNTDYETEYTIPAGSYFIIGEYFDSLSDAQYRYYIADTRLCNGYIGNFSEDYDTENFRNGILYASTDVVIRAWSDPDTGDCYFSLVSGSVKLTTVSVSHSSSKSYFSSDSDKYVTTFIYPRTYTNHINNPTICTDWQYTSNDYNYAYRAIAYYDSPGLDPSAITLSDSNPSAGSQATAIVTPTSTTLNYGTLTYTYQYSINNGSTWTTIGTSTSTSISFTIPGSASQIKVRVQASDGIGYTSSTYIESSNYTVNQYTSYAGVSGVVKGIKPVVCVSGAIKTSVTTKKGVSGVVK